MKRKVLYLAPVALTAVLTACGGHSAPQSQPKTSTSVTVPSQTSSGSLLTFKPQACGTISDGNATSGASVLVTNKSAQTVPSFQIDVVFGHGNTVEAENVNGEAPALQSGQSETVYIDAVKQDGSSLSTNSLNCGLSWYMTQNSDNSWSPRVNFKNSNGGTSQ